MSLHATQGRIIATLNRAEGHKTNSKPEQMHFLRLSNIGKFSGTLTGRVNKLVIPLNASKTTRVNIKHLGKNVSVILPKAASADGFATLQITQNNDGSLSVAAACELPDHNNNGSPEGEPPYALKKLKLEQLNPENAIIDMAKHKDLKPKGEGKAKVRPHSLFDYLNKKADGGHYTLLNASESIRGRLDLAHKAADEKALLDPAQVKQQKQPVADEQESPSEALKAAEKLARKFQADNDADLDEEAASANSPLKMFIDSDESPNNAKELNAQHQSETSEMALRAALKLGQEMESIKKSLQLLS